MGNIEWPCYSRFYFALFFLRAWLSSCRKPSCSPYSYFRVSNYISCSILNRPSTSDAATAGSSSGLTMKQVNSQWRSPRVASFGVGERFKQIDTCSSTQSVQADPERLGMSALASLAMPSTLLNQSNSLWKSPSTPTMGGMHLKLKLLCEFIELQYLCCGRRGRIR